MSADCARVLALSTLAVLALGLVAAVLLACLLGYAD